MIASVVMAPPRGTAARLARLLPLLLIAVSEVPAQSASGSSIPQAAQRAVLMLVDDSYSMGLGRGAGSERRIDLALRAARELGRLARPEEEWSLACLGGSAGTPHVGRTAAALAAVDWVTLGRPDGTTPIAEAVGAAMSYLDEHAHAPERSIVLLSDGLATDGGALPDPAYLRDRSTTLTVLMLWLEDMEPIQGPLAAFAQASGGASFDLAAVVENEAWADVLDAVRAPAVPEGRVRPSPAGDPPAVPVRAVRPIRVRPIWLTFLLLPLAAWRLARRVGGVLRSLAPQAGGAPGRAVTLEIRRLGDHVARSVVAELPASVGYSASARLRLPPAAGSAVPDFEIQAVEGGIRLASPRPLHVNGVARRQKLLRVGDVVVYGPHRVVYAGVVHRRDGAIRAAPFGFAWELVMLSCALLGGLLFPDPITVHLREDGRLGSPAVAAADTGPPIRGLAPVLPQPTPVTVVAPGESWVGLEADALFFHAHPDDESIDFGALLARLTASGGKVAVALLTDGESGLDQYPDRHSGGLYADHDLGAAELARMRPLEARAALARLGVSSYIRLGLRNHPYAAGSQYLSTATLMAAWGGEERLVARIVQIIEDLRPSLVVSPDSEHAGALEHFEHAGVGHLVDKALRRVRARGRHTVVGHLRSVDPRNSPTYGALEAVDTLERRLPGGPTLRAMQVSALAEHRTQRDATVIAAETLTGVRFEYYVTDFLDGHGPLDAFLARW